MERDLREALRGLRLLRAGEQDPEYRVDPQYIQNSQQHGMKEVWRDHIVKWYIQVSEALPMPPPSSPAFPPGITDARSVMYPTPNSRSGARADPGGRYRSNWVRMICWNLQWTTLTDF